MSESRPPTPDGERELVARGPLTLFDGQDLPRLQPVLHRTWAMPMKWTFEVKPLRECSCAICGSTRHSWIRSLVIRHLSRANGRMTWSLTALRCFTWRLTDFLEKMLSDHGPSRFDGVVFEYLPTA